MKIKKSTWLPSVLLVYMAVMAVIGYGDYANGRFSALYYFGIMGAELAVIVLLHLALKRRERLRREREEDMRGHDQERG